jgi:hypothetical protein
MKGRAAPVPEAAMTVFKKLGDLKASRPAETFAPPTPKVSRQKKAKVLTAAERAAFLATRPDLAPKG